MRARSSVGRVSIVVDEMAERVGQGKAILQGGHESRKAMYKSFVLRFFYCSIR